MAVFSKKNKKSCQESEHEWDGCICKRCKKENHEWELLSSSSEVQIRGYVPLSNAAPTETTRLVHIHKCKKCGKEIEHAKKR
ncbi:MAG: hypothetical protein FWF92_05420 [Oscillospiraceae bacterium]|nr:hypothetical protein [Oscillospiraceae bacterium]